MTNHKENRRTVIAYWKGYKKGYMDNADKEYTKVQFDSWLKHVAGQTEKHACFNHHSRSLNTLQQ